MSEYITITFLQLKFFHKLLSLDIKIQFFRCFLQIVFDKKDRQKSGINSLPPPLLTYTCDTADMIIDPTLSSDSTAATLACFCVLFRLPIIRQKQKESQFVVKEICKLYLKKAEQRLYCFMELYERFGKYEKRRRE